MKYTFYSNKKRIVLSDNITIYNEINIENTKNFIILKVIKKDLKIDDLGKKLLSYEISYIKFLRLTKLKKKTRIIKFRKDKNRVVQIQKSLL